MTHITETETKHENNICQQTKNNVIEEKLWKWFIEIGKEKFDNHDFSAVSIWHVMYAKNERLASLPLFSFFMIK